MPQYSGDQIYQNGAYGYSVSPTALNHRKTAASSNFGTRKLAFYSVYVEQDYGLVANWRENNSLFYQMVRAIQQGFAGIGGADAPYENSNPSQPGGSGGAIRGGGGGGAELFYVGEPQNSASSPLNQQDNWYGAKPTNYAGSVDVVSASGTGTIATLTFTGTQSVPPFNVGDPVVVSNVGSGYNCDTSQKQFVTECTTTYVKFNSTATATLTSLEGSVNADLGWDCFTFAIVDDADPFLPEGSGFFGDVDFSGVAGDVVCFCNGGRFNGCRYPFNLSQAIRHVLITNELDTTFSVWRLNPNFGLTTST